MVLCVCVCIVVGALAAQPARTTSSGPSTVFGFGFRVFCWCKKRMSDGSYQQMPQSGYAVRHLSVNDCQCESSFFSSEYPVVSDGSTRLLRLGALLHCQHWHWHWHFFPTFEPAAGALACVNVCVHHWQPQGYQASPGQGYGASPAPGYGAPPPAPAGYAPPGSGYGSASPAYPGYPPPAYPAASPAAPAMDPTVMVSTCICACACDV
jgi:hypothetical protein